MADKNYFNILFGNGLNTSKPKQFLSEGELTQAVGIWYPRGSGPFKAQLIPGRSSLKTFPQGAASKGVKYLSFDTPSTTDQLLGYAGSGYYIGPINTGGPLTYLEEASVSGTHMFAVHHSDRYYVVNGYSENRVIDDTLTFRSHGMYPPYQFNPASFAVGTGGLSLRPSGHSLGGLTDVWTDPQYGYDSSSGLDLYAYGTPEDVGVSYMYYSGWASQIAGSGAYLNVRYSTNVGGNTGEKDIFPGRIGQPGRGLWSVDYRLSGTGSWTEAFTNPFLQSVPETTVQVPLPSGYDISGLQVRFTITCTTQYPSPLDFVYIYDTMVLGINGTGDPDTPAFSTTSGLRYAITEYDANRSIESEAWTNPSLVTLSSGLAENSVIINLPSAAVNPNATHFRIYRSPDGLDGIQYLGLVGEAPVGSARFVDNFKVDKDSIALPLYQTLAFSASDGATAVYVPLYRRPNRWKNIAAYEGSLVGVDALNPRTLWYTPPGYPEYSPEPYNISSFSLPDHDELVGMAAVDRVLVVFAKDHTFSIQGLPLVDDGSVFSQPPVFRLGGVPGCVGPKAFTEITDESGQAAAAWVARNGIYLTDGYKVRLLTSEVDWDDFFASTSNKDQIVLFWHKDEQLLVMYYPSGSGDNDRYIFLHFAHQKETGYPKITGPHYGRIRDIDDGIYNGAYQVYSVNPFWNQIYKEFDGVTDTSYSYNTTMAIPMIVGTGRIYDNETYKDFHIDRMVLDHSHWDVSGVMTVRQGEDFSSYIGSAVNTFSLSGYRGTEIPVDKAGQWVEAQIVMSGVISTTKSAIHGLRVLLSPSRQAGQK